MERRAFVFRGLGAIAAGFVTTPLAGLSGPSQAASMPSPLSESVVSKFATTLKGTIYRDGMPEYQKLRKVFAGKVDFHPALIVHAVTPADVSKTVLFAKVHKLPLAVRGGGHSYGGYGSCDGGLVIDLSGLNAVVVAADTASVRAGGGALAGAVEDAVSKVGRAAVFGQCPSVGIGGYLTGGGVGPLMNKFGLGCDNVTEAEVVLADGRIVTANPDQNPDLFWAIRGGGGNFGVVTSFNIKLHPVTQVYAGMIGVGADNMVDLLSMVRDVASTASDDLSAIGLLSGDGKGGYELWQQVCGLGKAEDFETGLSPLRQAKGLIADKIKIVDIYDLESQIPMDLAPVRERYTAGFLPTLSEEVIALLVGLAKTAPGAFELTIVPIQGAVTRVAVSDTAFPLRTKGFAIGLSCGWKKTEGPEKADQWIKACAARLRPLGRGAYVNIMDRDEGPEAVAAAYADNYARLSHLKAHYDPTNLFALNQNILPKT